MKKLLKLLAVLVGILVAGAAIGVAGLYAWSGAELKKKAPLPSHAFTAPTDSASIARGEHLTRAIAKCADCHGQDMGGQVMIDDPAIGKIFAPNLTRGEGGIAAAYDDAAWERAVRHGIAPDGRRLLIMPSNEYQFLSDEDLGMILAYVKQLPAVSRSHPAPKVGPVARALYAAGQLPLFPANAVRHADDVVPSVVADSTVAYGKYLGDVGCSGCHGATYGGGAIPGTPPDWPAPANLTPAALDAAKYDLAGFTKALREGVRPNGSTINPFMPIHATKLMTDVEIVATWKYLRTLESKEFGSR
jgi:mono/diheme cytochrome c family protein